MSTYKPLSRKEVEKRFIGPYERDKLQKALPWVRGVVTKAAEEIERIEQEAEHHRLRSIELDAEVMRLRAALEEIWNGHYQTSEGNDCRIIAREILYPTQPAEATKP